MTRKGLKVIDKGLQRRLAAMRELDQYEVSVGIQPEDAGKTDGKEGNGATLGQIAQYMEYGTQEIPARPWLSQGMKRAQPAALLTEAVKEIVKGRDVYQALDRAGLAAVAKVQEGFTEEQWAPLKPSTIKDKGSSQPLIDTGRLRQSVRHKVTRKGGR